MDIVSSVCFRELRGCHVELSSGLNNEKENENKTTSKIYKESKIIVQSF
jgi:hypothetical protein